MSTIASSPQLVSSIPDAPIRALAPIVSVCIVNWNCRDYLRACLESLLHQEQGVSFEIIVVDNGSTDGAAQMVAEEYPEVILVRNPDNLGFARANNQAARVARGEHLFFLNNDTIVEPFVLQKLWDYLCAHPEAGVVGPRLRDGQGEVQCSAREKPTIGALLHHTFLLRWTGLFRRAYHRYRGRECDSIREPCHVEVLMGAALFLRRDFFEKIGGWNERHVFGGEDIALCTRIARERDVVYLPYVEITHYGRISSRQNVDFVHCNTFIGITQSLRETGASRLLVALYKLIVTVDAPLQWILHLFQYGWRRLRGRRKQAERSLWSLRGIGAFLRHGLWRFWKA